jgi:exonuclease SbcC
MKLHTLEITAFGPFAGKERIDFADLGENPLFLIDGPTGAGKSSILHAVCYGLYGETTDSERKDLGIRCDHADPDTLTEITLEFSLRGNRYRIRREPTQMRPAKRGGGETEHKATAHFMRIAEDGTEETLVPKKKTEADAAIKEILGLTADQFRQVMVLPQGRFRELLLAKSDDRQEILSTLFQTEIYKRIEQLLKDRAGNIERQNTEFEVRKSDALHEVHVADVDALIEVISQATTELDEKGGLKAKADELKRAEEQKLKNAEALKQRFAARDAKQKELLTHEETKSAIEDERLKLSRAEKAAIIFPELKALQNMDRQVKQAESQKADAEQAKSQNELEAEVAAKALTDATKAYEQRDSLKAKVTQLESYKSILAGYETLKAEAASAKESHKKTLSKVSRLNEQITIFDEQIKDRRTQIDSLASQVAQKATATEQRIGLERRVDKRKELDMAIKQLAQFESATSRAQAAYELAGKLYQEAQSASDRGEMFWYANQAALLAQKLEENNPCPVCGSESHPHPAEAQGELEGVNQESLDQAKAAASARLNARYEAQQLLAESRTKVTGQQDLIGKITQELGDDSARALDKLIFEHDRAEEKLKQITIAEQQQSTLVHSQAEDEAKRLELEAERNKLTQEIPDLAAAKASAENQLTTAEANLPEAFRGLDALARALTETRQVISKLELAFEAARKAQLATSNNVAAITSTLNATVKQLGEILNRQKEQAEVWRSALLASEFEDKGDFDHSMLDAGARETLRAKINDYDQKLQTLKTQVELMTQQLGEQQVPDIEALKEGFNVANLAYIEAEEVWSGAQQHKLLLERTRTKVRLLGEQQQAIREQYDVVGKMAKAASGRGDVRVSLERFVLGNLLDSVLGIASQRLHAMSKGQYKLVRQNEANQKRTATAGLDLAIDDAYSGKTRPVATLSGGESFMASLSLALALSDVVQQRSGGIQLDTLFIDEGFGSLDQDSLQLAIDMLVDLQATGRTIGVISHVSELKDQMPLRIDVKSGRTGSTVSVANA